MTIKRPATGWKFERVTTHPGEVLREEFLLPLGMSANSLAIRLRISAPRLHAILHEKRAVTPDTAMRLARCFGTSAQFFDQGTTTVWEKGGTRGRTAVGSGCGLSKRRILAVLL